MRKKTGYLIIILFALLICGCANAPTGLKPLDKPAIKISEKILKWSQDDNATGYVVDINNSTYLTYDNTFSLENLPAGDYKIKVKALGDNKKYSDSDWSDEIDYKASVKLTEPLNLRFTEEYLVWNKVNNAVGYIIYNGDKVQEVWEAVCVISDIGEYHYPLQYLSGDYFCVKAIGDNDIFFDSDYSGQLFISSASDEIKFKTKTLPSGKLSIIGTNIIGGLGSSIIIPAKINEIEVEAIGDAAFTFLTRKKSITFEEGCNIKTIGDSAFYTCENIKKITIPKSVESIGNKAFHWCSNLEYIEFEEESNLKFIGEECFRWCLELKEIDIPEGVLTLSDKSFHGCSSLKKIIIPSTVENFGAISPEYSLAIAIAIIKIIEPFTIHFSTFNNSTIIYVPDESVEAYRGTEGWYYLDIRPISSYDED